MGNFVKVCPAPNWVELTCGVFSQHYELVVTRLPFNERAMLGSNRLSDTPVGWPHIVDANAETIGTEGR